MAIANALTLLRLRLNECIGRKSISHRSWLLAVAKSQTQTHPCIILQSHFDTSVSYGNCRKKWESQHSNSPKCCNIVNYFTTYTCSNKKLCIKISACNFFFDKIVLKKSSVDIRLQHSCKFIMSREICPKYQSFSSIGNFGYWSQNFEYINMSSLGSTMKWSKSIWGNMEFLIIKNFSTSKCPS